MHWCLIPVRRRVGALHDECSQAMAGAASGESMWRVAPLSELPSLDNSAIVGVVDNSWCSVEHFDGFLKAPPISLLTKGSRVKAMTK
jgi:hypothetical protein